MIFFISIVNTIAIRNIVPGGEILLKISEHVSKEISYDCLTLTLSKISINEIVNKTLF